MKKLTPFTVALIASGLVAGCRVGPNYHRPVMQPPAFRDLSENPQVQAQAASYADLPWWQVFQDPQLQELIRTAIKQNYDLQLATERIVEARAQLAITRSSLFPQVQGNGDFNGGKEHNFQTKSNFFTLTADAAFQLDFFGKLRRATEASRAELLATEDARQTVVLTLVSDVASDYFAAPATRPSTPNHARHRNHAARLGEAHHISPSARRGHKARRSAGSASSRFGHCSNPRPRAADRAGQKMPSAFSLATTRSPCDADARWWSSRFLPKYRRACLHRSSSAGPTFARPSKPWSPRTPKSESPRLSSFRKSR